MLEKLVEYMQGRSFISDTVRVDTSRFSEAERKASISWIRSLGWEPNDLRAVFALVNRHGEWELHLSRFLPDSDGRPRWLDVAHQDLVSAPEVVSLGSSPWLPDFDLKAVVPS
jgi:hypothetical protein